MKKKDPESTSVSPAAPSAPRITPEDIQSKEFRIARFRGYKERDVDEFLDQLTLSWGAVLEDNRRLRGTSAAGVASDPPVPDEVGRQAEEILQRARNEADRIVQEARARASAIGGGEGDRQAVSAFLGKEREFLQSLATLVQGHAEGVKGMAREVFASGTRVHDEPAPPAEAPAPPTEPPDARPPVPPEAPAAEAVQAEPPAPPPDEPRREEDTDDEPIRVEEAEPAVATRTDAEGRPGAGDRSLRELFWGEE